MKKTILLIGSSGFIGTQLIKKLKNDYNLINVNKSNGFDVCKRNSFNKYSLKKIDFILILSLYVILYFHIQYCKFCFLVVF